MNNTIALENGYMTLSEVINFVDCPVFYDEDNEQYGNRWFVIKSVNKSDVREHEDLYKIETTDGYYFEWYDNFSENSKRNPKFRRPVGINSVCSYMDDWY